MREGRKRGRWRERSREEGTITINAYNSLTKGITEANKCEGEKKKKK